MEAKAEAAAGQQATCYLIAEDVAGGLMHESAQQCSSALQAGRLVRLDVVLWVTRACVLTCQAAEPACRLLDRRKRQCMASR